MLRRIYGITCAEKFKLRETSDYCVRHNKAKTMI